MQNEMEEQDDADVANPTKWMLWTADTTISAAFIQCDYELFTSHRKNSIGMVASESRRIHARLLVGQASMHIAGLTSEIPLP